MTRHELSYDSHGINGPDEYRSRIATFAPGPARDKYGPLFEAAPELLAALKIMFALYEDHAQYDEEGYETAAINAARAAIARAQGAL